jgi:membrane protease YdiL (CAAX protease family)
MDATSWPTSSTPSQWSRNDRALALWLAVSALFAVLSFAAQSSAPDDDKLFFEYSLAIAGTIQAAIIVGIAYAGGAFYGNARRALGLRRFPLRYIWYALGSAVAAIVVSGLLEPLLHAGKEQGLVPEHWVPGGGPAFALNGVVTILIVPFSEELFFRGLGVRALAFAGPVVAVGGTAIVFAVVHGILAGLIPLGFFAVLLGLLRYRSESVWPGYIAHASYNAVGVLSALAISLHNGPAS